MARRYCYKDVLPLTTLVILEGVNVGLNTLFKAATLEGISYYVFVAYTYAIATLILFPALFISRSARVLPPPNSYIHCKFVLLGLTGTFSQMAGFIGISYSSPILASAISNLTPAFTFILAIIFRMESVALKRRTCQAKVLGTIISITGAFVVTLYKGPPIAIASPSSNSLTPPLSWSIPNWVLGGILLTAQCILCSLFYIFQAQILEQYASEYGVIFFYSVHGTVIAATVALITEGTSSAWMVRPHMALASVLCSGVFGQSLITTLHSWALRLKGPVFVAMFKPLSIPIAVAMGVMFLGDVLHLGSLIGAAIISIGFYTVIWGIAKEESPGDHGAHDVESSPTAKVPLLENYSR